MPVLRLFSIRTLVSSFLVVIFASHCALPSSAAGGSLKPGECWLMHMSSNFLGNVTFSLGNTATSVFMEKMGIEAFGDDKVNQILILNHRDKTYLQEPRTEWRKRAAKYQAKAKKDSLYKGFKVSKGKKAKIAGLNCTGYDVNPVRKDGTVDLVNQKKQLWVTEELDSNKGVARQFAMEILRVFAQLEELPVTAGVLVRLKADKGRKMVTMLDTYKVEKGKKTVELKVPKGYHRVKDEVALLWGDDSSTGDMFGAP